MEFLPPGDGFPLPDANGAYIDALLEKARSIRKEALNVAELTFSNYNVLDCDDEADCCTRATIRQPIPRHVAVTVLPYQDVCSCSDFRREVAPLRRQLIAAGFVLLDLGKRNELPVCRHIPIITLLQLHQPDKFTQALRRKASASPLSERSKAR